MQTSSETMKTTAFPVKQQGEINPLVASLGFERLKWKLSQSSEAIMSPETADLAEREYRRFLTLKIEFPDAVMVPTDLMDKFWHAHILDTIAYARDCKRLFGDFVHHCPYFGEYGDDDKSMMEDAFALTKTLYERFFGESPPETEALPARCRSKPCHVPTGCRCR